jgi:hypothetical protein
MFAVASGSSEVFKIAVQIAERSRKEACKERGVGGCIKGAREEGRFKRVTLSLEFLAQGAA